VGTEATVKLPLSATPTTGDGAPDPIVEVKRLTKGKMFSLDGFDRYPDISETPTGILSSDIEAAMFLKSSIHAMLTDWFEMKPSMNLTADKSIADVVFIMASGVSSLTEKLQAYNTDAGPSIVIVLCNTHTPTSATTFDSLRVLYVPQPYVLILSVFASC
jgi:hypothetical protein